MLRPPLVPGGGGRHCHSLVNRTDDPTVFVVQVSSPPPQAAVQHQHCTLLPPPSGVCYPRPTLTLLIHLQDGAAAYPAYVIHYSRHAGSLRPGEVVGQVRAGSASLVSRGEPAIRAAVRPFVDAAAAAATEAAPGGGRRRLGPRGPPRTTCCFGVRRSAVRGSGRVS